MVWAEAAAAGLAPGTSSKCACRQGCADRRMDSPQAVSNRKLGQIGGANRNTGIGTGRPDSSKRVLLGSAQTAAVLQLGMVLFGQCHFNPWPGPLGDPWVWSSTAQVIATVQDFIRWFRTPDGWTRFECPTFPPRYTEHRMGPQTASVRRSVFKWVDTGRRRHAPQQEGLARCEARSSVPRRLPYGPRRSAGGRSRVTGSGPGPPAGTRRT